MCLTTYAVYDAALLVHQQRDSHAYCRSCMYAWARERPMCAARPIGVYNEKLPRQRAS